MADTSRPPVDRRRFNAGRVMAAGGALAIVGSFLTWATAHVAGLSLTIKGTASGKDGNITFVLGIVVMIVAALCILRRQLQAWVVLLGGVAGLLALLVAIYDFADLGDKVVSGTKVSYDPGAGLYLELVAGLVASSGAALALRAAPSGPAEPDVSA